MTSRQSGSSQPGTTRPERGNISSLRTPANSFVINGRLLAYKWRVVYS